MSRAAAAQSSPTTSLAVRETPNGMPLALLARSAPFGDKSDEADFGAMMMALGLLSYSQSVRSAEKRKHYLDEEQKKKNKKFRDYEEFTARIPGVFNINYATWTYVLDFLLVHNTYQPIPLVLAPETIAVEKHGDRVINFARHLQNTAESCVIPSSTQLNTDFFSKNYQAGFEFTTLLDAALNADLPMVEKILAEASPKNRKAFLSTPGKAIITHAGIERTGTPLQMALYSHDDKMVEVFKQHMDPVEFQRQWETVFGSDYHAFLERQKADATRLCGELENAFKDATSTDVANTLHYIANTTSELQAVLNRFKKNLEQYVRQNPVHNPYILHQLFVIYDELLKLDMYKLCLLSTEPIGLVEKLSSAIWLSHISDGIFYLGKNDSPIEPTRGFLSNCSSPVDVRCLDRLGVDYCVDILGWLLGAPKQRGESPHLSLAFRCKRPDLLQKLCQAKTTNLEHLCRGTTSWCIIA